MMDPERSRRSVDNDARFDRHGVHAATIALAILGVLGLVLLFWTGGQMMGLDWQQAVPAVVVVLVFLLAVFAAFYLGSGQGPGSVGKAVLRTLATVGGCVSVLVTLVGAVVIFFFVVCLATTGPNH